MNGFLSPCVAVFIGICTSFASAQAKRPFTVADDIAYTHLVTWGQDAYTEWYTDGIQVSPNGEFFTVLTCRGRLDLNLVEESLRFYRTRDVEAFLQHSADGQPPSPVWVVNQTGKKEPISDIRWLPDSSGVTIQEKTEDDNDRIVLADLRKKTTELLISGLGWVEGFDITDRKHYVYVIADQAARKQLEQKREAERRAPMSVYTASDVWDMVVPDSPGRITNLLLHTERLWAATGGKPFEVQFNGAPLTVADIAPGTALSPDGHSVVLQMKAKNIPQSWEKLYPPSYPSNPDNEIHAGASVFEYVRLDLRTGKVQSLTDAPTSDAAGWGSGDGNTSWSNDGQSVLLPGTFIKSKDGSPSQPCVAVVDIASNTGTCVETLKGRKGPGQELEDDYHYILDERFVGGDRNLIEMHFGDRGGAMKTSEYRRAAGGEWQLAKQSDGIHKLVANDLEVTVKQGLNQPPLLVASSQGISRTILDPNPQFKDLELGQAKVYTWKDKEGRNWTGGLYLPVGYQPGRRYPLVIQTHGFSESQFSPSGSFSTAFAAEEFASAGIAVLQVGGGPCTQDTPTEAPCNASAIEVGARQLVSEGLVDAQNIGYIGFSRTCYHGMELLTDSSLLKAALLADGVTVDYFQFVLFGIEEFNKLIGAAPFGEGLQLWLKNSPGFHLDKVAAPLLIAVEKAGAIEMFQPYSQLRYLKKPVELVRMNTDEHVITNPVERLASQGLSVDWFRFWLQGYEDPDPSKAEQYKRWHELRALQAENEKKTNNSQATSN